MREFDSFEAVLTGGHANSLGRTIELVEHVLEDKRRVEKLYACYGSKDEVVRLRASNAIKRIAIARPEWLIPFIDRLYGEIADLDQPSAQWTLAQIAARLYPLMSDTQRKQATSILKRNLAQHNDWIVLNESMKTLAGWTKDDAALSEWLGTQLERHAGDKRHSVSKTAKKMLDLLD